MRQMLGPTDFEYLIYFSRYSIVAHENKLVEQKFRMSFRNNSKPGGWLLSNIERIDVTAPVYQDDVSSCSTFSLWSDSSSSSVESFDITELLSSESGESDPYFVEDFLIEGFEQDPYSFELYTTAISQGEETDTTVRVNIIGNFAQGKTSLAKRLLGQETKDIESTNNVEINHCKYKNIQDEVKFFSKKSEEDESEVVYRIATVARSEKEKDIQAEDRELSSITEQMVGKQGLIPENSTSVRMIKGRNQSDIEKCTLTENEQQIFSNLLKSNNFRNNPDKDLEIWDFAGQFIFYTTHTLFHSRRAIYLLVFDLSVPLDKVVQDNEYPEENSEKDMEQYAKFWMNSVHTYVGSNDGLQPPVILVGTHKDKLEGDDHAKQRFKDEYFEKVRTLFEDTVMINHINATDFAVDNTDPNDADTTELRKELIRIGTKFAEATKIPARWIPLERALKIIRNQKIITFEKVMEIDSQNEFPLHTKEQVKLFLLYHHAKGTLFYFDEEPVSSFVVLDTHFLIDAFKCIITSGRFCKKDPSSRRLWNKLTKEARLEKELVENLWKQNISNDFYEHKNELLMFLQKHLIISEVSQYDENTRKSTGLGWYIVPCFLRNPVSEMAVKLFLTGKQQTSFRFVLRFYKSPVVQVVFFRVLAALIGRWSVLEVTTTERKFLLYENLGVLRLDKFHAGIIERKNENIELRVVSLSHSENVASEVADCFRRFAESVVAHEFNKLRGASQELENAFIRSARCNHNEHGLAGSSFVLTLQEIEDQKSFPCPDLMNHLILGDTVMCEWFQPDKVTEITPDYQLNEKQLGKFAQAIGKNWEFLGLELGLTDAQIQHVSMDNQTSLMRIYRMLTTWKKMKEMKEEEATFNALLQAMRLSKGSYVDWDKIRNIIDEINLERAHV